jgi:signal transduction histidine kinase
VAASPRPRSGVPPPITIAPELESTVYRLVQECLTNAVRHAGASRVRIDVTERDAFLDVAVSDDGRGFDPVARAAGFGLVGMRERVALAAGKLAIESGPGGTTVRARLPVRRVAAEPD